MPLAVLLLAVLALRERKAFQTQAVPDPYLRCVSRPQRDTLFRAYTEDA